VGICRFRSAKGDDFSIAVDGGLFIISAVVSKMTLHQPGFRVARVNAENPVEKDLGDLPPFFGHRTGSVRPIDSDLGVISAPIGFRLALKKPESISHVGFQNELLKLYCQEFLRTLFAEFLPEFWNSERKFSFRRSEKQL
jgi:hypothetical protein